jgi:acyl-CoA reductase-like NAD-dependent aldehyde dehydrogenase
MATRVVLKPADLVPGCAWALADIISRAGLPAGVFNLVMGRGSVVGAVMLDHPRGRRDQLHRLGAGGRALRGRSLRAARPPRCSSRWAARTRWSCSTMPTSNVPSSARATGAFFSTGQRCTASSRLIVTEGIRPLRRRADAPAHGRAEGRRRAARRHEIGPVVERPQLAQDLSYIDIGRKEGAKLLPAAANAGARHARASTWPGAVHRHHARHAHQPRRDLRARWPA